MPFLNKEKTNDSEKTQLMQCGQRANLAEAAAESMVAIEPQYSPSRIYPGNKVSN